MLPYVTLAIISLVCIDREACLYILVLYKAMGLASYGASYWVVEVLHVFRHEHRAQGSGLTLLCSWTAVVHVCLYARAQGLRRMPFLTISLRVRA